MLVVVFAFAVNLMWRAARGEVASMKVAMLVCFNMRKGEQA